MMISVCYMPVEKSIYEAIISRINQRSSDIDNLRINDSGQDGNPNG